MDENYQTYLNRAMRLTLPEAYRSQIQYIQESAKFRPHPEHGHEAVPFPGFSVITPPGQEDVENSGFYTRLKDYQQQIAAALGPDLLAPVPADSFHMTLADLIWDSAYRDARQHPDFDRKLQDCIQQIFQQCQPISQGQSISFQAIGLMVMTRAIAVCLAPTDEASYDRLLKFRRALYQNQELIGLGIEQQYYFTPHITLGYFGAIPASEALPALGEQCSALNQSWLDREPQSFLVQRAELRKFDDMTHYYREADWTVFEF